MSKSELELTARAEQFMNRVYPSLINYPKVERYSLCQDIKLNLYGLNKCLAMSHRIPSKRSYYAQEADGYLETIRVLIKLSNELKYISTSFYRELSYELTLIGRMMGVYIRSI